MQKGFNYFIKIKNFYEKSQVFFGFFMFEICVCKKVQIVIITNKISVHNYLKTKINIIHFKN